MVDMPKNQTKSGNQREWADMNSKKDAAAVLHQSD